MGVKIVNAEDKYGRVLLQEATTRGYIHIAAQTCKSSFPFQANTDTALLDELNEWVLYLKPLEVIENIHVFRAVGLPPVGRLPYIKDHTDSIRVARFDVAVLIETKHPEAMEQVQDTPLYEALLDYLESQSMSVHVSHDGSKYQALWRSTDRETAYSYLITLLLKMLKP